MTVLRTVTRGSRAAAELEYQKRLAPRDDIVAERITETAASTVAVAAPASQAVEHEPSDDAVRFESVGGPFSHYERRLCVPRPTAPPAAAAPDRQQHQQQRPPDYELLEVITYRLAVPVWGWLFHWPVKRALRHRKPVYGYWWAPPDRIDERPAMVLGLLCCVQVLDGYLGTVLSQTLTFAADEFGRGNTAQGIVLAVVRVGVLIALAGVALADRHGRRRLLLAAGTASCVITAAGALAPGLWFLGATQLAARGLSTALGILIVIYAAEEMPARSRSWAMSVLVLCAGLGSGMAVWVLPVADLHIAAWRIIYVAPLAGLAVMAWVGRRLPESRRFTPGRAGPRRASGGRAESLSDDGSTDAALPADDTASDLPEDFTDAALLAAQRRRRRLALLAVSAFLIAMFAAPASGLRNDFLKDERDFSAAAISLFTLVTNTPVGIGILAGGYLADRRGRRPVGAFGLVAGAVLGAWAFFNEGAALWLLSLGAGVLGALAVPALAVYGPELFGTYRRGRSNGLIVAVGVAGSALGLLTAGWLSDVLDGRLAPALALLAAGPLAVAALVVWKYPETAGRELEDLNPEDGNT